MDGSDALFRKQKRVLDSPGLAHGFVVLSHQATVLYKTTDFIQPKMSEQSFGLTLNIDWPIEAATILSDKDRGGLSLREAEKFA
jgi:dTDP-4-dehydrorhamnose 3,5-epimerase